MESLTRLNERDDAEKNQTPIKSKQEPEVERVKLGKIEAAKVGIWLKQLDESSKGFLQLTKSDLVNFLIRERKDELTTKEIVLIRAGHYDPIRHLNWITPRLKDALVSGDAEQISRLQDEIRSIELSVIKRVTGTAGELPAPEPLKQKRPRRKGASNDSGSMGSISADGLAGIRDGPA